MSFHQPASDPPTKLGIYRVLSAQAGLRVSPITFGAMSVGDKWAAMGMGLMDKESSFKLLDAYFDMGGNFIDTANVYQDGEWAEKRGIRDQLVIATKYTANYQRGDDSIAQKVNYVGNSSKSLHLSVEASLRKLRTSYIDILYVHWWDWETSVREVMDNLHHLVALRKVLYLGISDAPAWVVAQANQYALDHGKTPFVVYQGRWKVMERSFEREIIPMAREFGIALAPWDVLASGRFRTDKEEQRRRETGERGRSFIRQDWERNDVETKMSRALEVVADEVGVGSVTAVAIAYVMQKAPYVFPIVGGRKMEHLKANIQALDIRLSKKQIEYLESVVPLDPGFPTSIIRNGTTYNKSMIATAKMAKQPMLQPIFP
ncbi:NADP-dependent oxidoreductase domain-containing protein [Desarmillaria tabescens]|uniref:NADP-dependent oxidoreductase domain-containing protein n=1 Tax=Armillaria tabescens TaxID=1929756 RepID=A0AA39K634_ARMTA|nr:NADP-dependent oxidoreductase domain-containing protein [Desarmillaria tabescens]KAK0455249.1 NADP-dependent oxidoreductase domain-containing protein [Desarmillaria tabescens]